MGEYPKIRNISPIPVNIKGEQLIALRDPHELNGSEQMVVVSPQTFAIATMFDGSNSIDDVQALLTRMNGGVLFPRTQLENVVAFLEQHLLLEGKAYNKAIDAYCRETVRRSILSGKTVPECQEEFLLLMDEVLAASQATIPQNQNIKGLICPHIDMQRGKVCFADAYRTIATDNAPQTYVILGTSHYTEPEARFILTRKKFSTPLGDVEVDNDFITRLQTKCDADFFKYEIAHKGEHSIEFQALFLQYLFGSKRPFTIVPILVGSFHDLLQENKLPEEDPHIAAFIHALKETAAEIDKPLCWIAGVDLAHVGMSFGDDTPPDDEMLEKIRIEDMATFEYAAKRDAIAFYRQIAAHNNKYRVCGLTAIYTFLQTIPSSTGHLLSYHQAGEQETGSVVTLGSMYFI